MVVPIAISLAPPIGSDETGFKLLLEAEVEKILSREDTHTIINTYRVNVEP